MGQETVWIIKMMLLPPGGIIILGLISLLLGRRSLLGGLLFTLTLAALYLFSAPYIANRLMQEVETMPALSATAIENSDAQAIVVLGGGRYEDAPEYSGDTVNSLLLERLRYAAFLSRRTGLPVIPSGGSRLSSEIPEAVLARQTLREEFKIPVLAIEEKSRTTWENATMTAALLRQLGIAKVFLVTHAMHMPRAMEMFRRADVEPIAAPTGFYHRDDSLSPFTDWLPSPKAMQFSYFALHELLGAAWYRVRENWQAIFA